MRHESMQAETYLTAVISPNRHHHECLAAALEEEQSIESFWTLADYPEPQQTIEILSKARSGAIVFLDFADPIRSELVARHLAEAEGRTVVIAIHHAPQSSAHVFELIRMGVQEVLNTPLKVRDVQRAFQRARRKLSPHSDGPEHEANLYAFLPAKPGVGATTIAAHSAAAASRLGNERTLLVDFDLQLGMTSFLFKLHGEHSVLNALSMSGQLKELWDQMVSKVGMLDVLGSAPVQFGREYPGGGAGALLDFAASRYGVVCVDLPGEMRDHELQTLARAREIFLVCTPDVGSLHLAKAKVDLLRQLEAVSRVCVILNRAQNRGSVSIATVEDVLQLPVRYTLPPAEREITGATHLAIPIDGKSPIGKQFENIGRRMIPATCKKPQEEARKEKRPRSFLEYFSLTPVRERTAGWNR
ncbi:MAG: hypothetical protein JNL98_03745 [Bryobacterales bacterium]|nr:hypothetical protein [Bryobacterales bacterium]